MMLQKMNTLLSMLQVLLLLCHLSTVQQMTIRSQNVTAVTTAITTTTTVQPAGLTGLSETHSIVAIIGGIIAAVLGILTIIGVTCRKIIMKWCRTKVLLYKIQKALKSKYKDKYSCISFVPFTEEREEAPFSSLYIPIKIEADGQTKQNIEEVIKKLSSDGRVPCCGKSTLCGSDGRVRLIVSSNPGCGKSTLCHKVILDWSNGGRFLSKKYKLVILLKARDFSSDQKIFSAIVEEMPSRYREKEYENGIKNILQNNKILILIDGYDELKAKDKQEDLKTLLCESLYENCDLIVTTRPHVKEIKKLMLMGNIRYEKVSISPFDEGNIKDYVKKFFKNENKKQKNHLYSQDDVDAFYEAATSEHVKHLATEPLTLFFLALVWKKNKKKQLPKILTHLYEDLLDALKTSYNHKNCNKEECQISVPDWKSLLDSLGKFAFDKLTEKEGGILSFEEPVINSYGITLATACAVGLLPKADPPPKTSNSKREPFISKKCEFYQFAHLSLQECLAARYFYNTIDNVASKKNLNTFRKQGGQFKNVTLFVCGYVSLYEEVNDEKLNKLNMLIGAMSKHIAYLTEEPFWKETGRNPLYKWVRVSNDCITDYYHDYDNVSDGNETFCVERAQCLHISGVAPNERYKKSKFNCEHGFCLSAICNALKDTSTLKKVKLEHLKCDCENRADELSGLIKNNENIVKLCIQDCDISSDIAERMAQHLTKLKALVWLDLSHNPIGDKADTVVECLSDSIQHLSMDGCGITERAAEGMARDLIRFQALVRLDLSHNPIGGGAKVVVERLIDSIQHLSMDGCGITKRAAEGMARDLIRFQALVRLDLSHNPIGGGAEEVVEHLSDSIQHLSMDGCGIRKPAAMMMAYSLTKLKALVRLDLSHNPIGGGAKEVVEHLSDSIQHLSMDGCGITEPAAMMMAYSLTKLKALVRLDLSHNPIGGGAKEVVEHLSDSIQHLSMDGCGITKRAAERMTYPLSKLKALVWLDLSHNPIGGGAKVVVERLSDSIQHLSMDGCGITERAAMMMAYSLSKLKALVWLDLSHNPIGEGAREVVRGLSDSIQHLSMDSCGITELAAVMMSLHLTKLKALVWLDLSHNPIGEGAREVVRGLSDSIQHLSMDSCGITELAAVMMSLHLTKLKALVWLDLSHNPIGGRAEEVVEPLSDSIQHLSMDSCGITELAAVMMSLHLTKLKALVWLDLSHNPIGEGAREVVRGLSDSIQHLSMDSCGITELAAVMMSLHLTKLKALVWLDLSHNPIGGRAEEVVEHLSDSIQHLHMNNCGITTEHVRKMVAHLNIYKLGCFSLSLADNGISEDDKKELGQMTKSTNSIDFVSSI